MLGDNLNPAMPARQQQDHQIPDPVGHLSLRAMVHLQQSLRIASHHRIGPRIWRLEIPGAADDVIEFLSERYPAAKHTPMPFGVGRSRVTERHEPGMPTLAEKDT
ncbi:hypothetical protein ACU4HD_42230 [Cupriavidus basilensis]